VIDSQGIMNPGNVIGGKYRLVQMLGAGGMGEVWQAVHNDTGGQVAVKLLRQQSAELRKRLLREARACGKLNHRNVIAVHDVDETAEGDPFLVMQLLSGETLADHLKVRFRLPQRRAAQIARDVARGLSAAHKAGVIHRDLKPANIFLHREDGSAEPVVKVLDFGVSKVDGQTDFTKKGAIIGSAPYMSPEQVSTPSELDHRSDIWSLGVVLFQMLVGQKPFNSDSEDRDVGIFMKILYEPIPVVDQFVGDVDPDLTAVVSRCLDRDRDRRFGSAEELIAILDRFAELADPAARGSSVSSLPSAYPAAPRPRDSHTISMLERPDPLTSTSGHDDRTRPWTPADRIPPAPPVPWLAEHDVVTEHAGNTRRWPPDALVPPPPPMPPAPMGASSPVRQGTPGVGLPPQPAPSSPSVQALAEGPGWLRPDGGGGPLIQATSSLLQRPQPPPAAGDHASSTADAAAGPRPTCAPGGTDAGAARAVGSGAPADAGGFGGGGGFVGAGALLAGRGRAGLPAWSWGIPAWDARSRRERRCAAGDLVCLGCGSRVAGDRAHLCGDDSAGDPVCASLRLGPGDAGSGVSHGEREDPSSAADAQADRRAHGDAPSRHDRGAERGRDGDAPGHGNGGELHVLRGRGLEGGRVEPEAVCQGGDAHGRVLDRDGGDQVTDRDRPRGQAGDGDVQAVGARGRAAAAHRPLPEAHWH
jgi:serine/threonine-protein kinase